MGFPKKSLMFFLEILLLPPRAGIIANLLISYNLKDVTIPFEFVDEAYDKKEYSLNRDLIQKNDVLYSLFYKTIDYSTNKIFVEISEVKEVKKSFDLGFVTDFSKE